MIFVLKKFSKNPIKNRFKKKKKLVLLFGVINLNIFNLILLSDLYKKKFEISFFCGFWIHLDKKGVNNFGDIGTEEVAKNVVQVFMLKIPSLSLKNFTKNNRLLFKLLLNIIYLKIGFESIDKYQSKMIF